MRLPSGDQRGWVSVLPLGFVNCSGAVLPSVAASQRAVLLLFPAKSTVVTWYTTDLPSGESCGSATRFRANKSSTFIGRFLTSTASAGAAKYPYTAAINAANSKIFIGPSSRGDWRIT